VARADCAWAGGPEGGMEAMKSPSKIGTIKAQTSRFGIVEVFGILSCSGIGVTSDLATP